MIINSAVFTILGLVPANPELPDAACIDRDVEGTY